MAGLRLVTLSPCYNGNIKHAYPKLWQSSFSQLSISQPIINCCWVPPFAVPVVRLTDGSPEFCIAMREGAFVTSIAFTFHPVFADFNLTLPPDKVCFCDTLPEGRPTVVATATASATAA